MGVDAFGRNFGDVFGGGRGLGAAPGTTKWVRAPVAPPQLSPRSPPSFQFAGAADARVLPVRGMGGRGGGGLQPQSFRAEYGADPGTFRSTSAQEMTAAAGGGGGSWMEYAQANQPQPSKTQQTAGTVSNIVSGLVSLFGKKSAPAPQYVTAPQTQYVTAPPPPPAAASWVGPAAGIGAIGVLGTIVYLLTRSA